MSEAASFPVARSWAVALPLPLPAYDFAAPHGFVGPLPLGYRALVPWQRGLLCGVVVGPGQQSAHQLREVAALLDDAPWVGAGFVAAAREYSDLSRLPLGLIVSDLLGSGLNALESGRLLHRVRAVAGADLSAFGEGAPDDQWREAKGFLAALLDRIREQGLLEEEFAAAPRLSTVYRPNDSGLKPLTARQQRAWEQLKEAGEFATQSAWAQAAEVSAGVVAGVLARGWASAISVPSALHLAPLGPPPAEVADTLPQGERWRLHGGRERARFSLLAARLRETLLAGQSALVLSPDAATLGRAWDALSGVAEEAGTRAALISGGVAEPQREAAWQAVQRGEARLVLGTALALPAPLSRLGLAVTLEEGSDAYKLLSGSALWVPDLAERVAQHAGAALAYVGCAPAVESLRVPGVVLPPPRTRLHVVDFDRPAQQPELGPLSGVQFRTGKGYPLSHDLAKVLRQVAERGRQAVLLAPRRGYSALIRCPKCEHVPQCRNCDIPLRLHVRRLECHQCGYQQPVPQRCSVCGGELLQARGPGTEWIAEEVRTLLPHTPIYRFDKDQQDDLSPLQAGESGVVVATQAVLSLAAPPNLALIGVTLADTWLSVSDFRASERYHRLLRSLAEWHPNRAPLLVVQTFQAAHPALQSLQRGEDALAFAQQEYELRRPLNYPPHGKLAQLTLSAREAERASAAADELAAALLAAGAQSGEVLGPAASPVARVKGLYPYHLLLRTRDEARLNELLRATGGHHKARLRLDITPRGGLG